MATHSQIVCLMGMHRSGTSLLAGWLNACGLHLGNNLLRRDFSNPTGHYEDLDFLLLHKEILKANGLHSSGLHLRAGSLEVSEYHKSKMSHLIEVKNELNKQWGWKDPRTCLFIDNYVKKIPGLRILLIHRPATEVIQSLLNRDWKRWKIQKSSEIPGGLNPKLLFQRHFKKQLIEQKLPDYLNACEIYFEKILIAINTIPTENIMAFKLTDFLLHDEEVFNDLKSKWKLNLNWVPANTLYKDELLGQASKIEITLTDKLRSLEKQLNDRLSKQ